MFGILRTRLSATGTVILFYALPFLLICGYATAHMPLKEGWRLFAGGLFTSLIGAGTISQLLRRFGNQTPRPSIVKEDIDLPSFFEDEKRELLGKIRRKEDEAELLIEENAKTSTLLQEALREVVALKQNSSEQYGQHKSLIEEYQQTITEQRSVILKKQENIIELESKVHDLSYEIKTLLQVSSMEAQAENITRTSPTVDSKLVEFPSNGMMLSEASNQYQVINGEQDESQQDNHEATSRIALTQLKRCIDIAQKITGANHFGPSRFRDLPVNNYALDLRRLCDNLRSETSCPIIVYSQKDHKLLFANNQTKDLLGWSPEKFGQDFHEIIQEGITEWKKGINQLVTNRQTRTSIVMKTKNGQNLLVHCLLATIPTGIFRNHIVGVLHE